jgi:uncharacterized Zn-finger protein
MCKSCGKAFTDLSSLRFHAVMHSGEKPYSSKQCGNTFGVLLLYESMNQLTAKRNPKCICNVEKFQLCQLLF